MKTTCAPCAASSHKPRAPDTDPARYTVWTIPSAMWVPFPMGTSETSGVNNLEEIFAGLDLRGVAQQIKR